MTAPLFLVEAPRLVAALPGSELVLDGPEGRHAAVVRRIAAGERIDVGDGAGTVAACEVVESLRDTVRLRVLRVRTVEPAQPRLVVVQALPKGDRGELAVETMTEVGVDAIVPWAAARCIPRWKAERGIKALARWRATAQEAAKQARRPRVPEIAPLATTHDVARLAGSADQALVLHEGADRPLARLEPVAAGDVVIVVGPEGGITDAELEELAAAGAGRYRLGPTVLRTSTAGVAALSVLLARTGRWG